MEAKGPFLLASISFLVIFIYFSYLVEGGFLKVIDFETTVNLQNHIPRILDFPFLIFSIIGTIEVSGLIWLVLALYSLLKKFYFALASLSLFAAGSIVEVFGKTFLYHPSPPYMLFRGENISLFSSKYIHTNYSYPSGHVFRTTFLVTFLIALIFLRSRKNSRFLLGGLLLVFLFVMMVSRVYLGEHWLSDVVGGFLLGISMGALSATAIPSKKFKQNLI